eukprot:PhF_6_TR22250/c0_g1_i1/m.31429
MAALIFIKIALGSATAMSAVDVVSQMMNKGMCYCQKPRRRKVAEDIESGEGKQTKENSEEQLASSSCSAYNCLGICPEKWNDFELDVARTLKTATTAAIVAPVMYGSTMFFVISPALYVTNAASTVAVAGTAALPYIYYGLKSNLSAQDLRYYIVPTVLTVASTTFATSYVLGTLVYHHRIAVWPMISSLGELYPENFVFTIGIGLTSAMYAMLVNAVGVSRKSFNDASLATTRNLGLRCGYASALGLMFVTIFPSLPGHPAVYPHYIGAATFLWGNIPFFGMLWVTKRSSEDSENTTSAFTNGLQTVTMCTYTVASILYPVLWSQYKISAAIAESAAAVSWMVVLGTLESEVQASAAIAVKGREAYDPSEDAEEPMEDTPVTKQAAASAPKTAVPATEATPTPVAPVAPTLDAKGKPLNATEDID